MGCFMITCFGTITKDTIDCNGKIKTSLGGAPYFFMNVCRKLGIEHSIVSTLGIDELENTKVSDKSSFQIIKKSISLLIKEDKNNVTCKILNYKPLNIKK